jgi:uncharacterized protein YbjT (DUF2867 family)
VETSEKIAVAGATGRVGRHVADVLEARGHDVVRMSRSSGVDVVTGDGLAEALAGVDCIVDTATGPSAEQEAATAFFTAAARNLQKFGERAGVRRIVVVSIIATDRFTAGYGAAKVAHEQAMLAGGIPVRILRAAQFHEFVSELVKWGRQGDVSYVPEMRTQLVGARTVAEALADLATEEEPAPLGGADPGDRRPAGGKPCRDGATPRRTPRRPDTDRGGKRPGRPGSRPLPDRWLTARPGRHPHRPEFRRVARYYLLTPIRSAERTR